MKSKQCLVVSSIMCVCSYGNHTYSAVVGRLTLGSLDDGVLLLLLLFELVAARPVLPIVEPTRSSNDLKAEEFLTSTNFLPILSPREPKISVVFSAASLTVSLVFW